MRIKLLLSIIFFINIIIITHSQAIWKLSFYDKENYSTSNPNNITILKGNYNTIIIKIEENKDAEISNITHINTKLSLNHSDLKMLPNEITIDTSKSKEYFIELGIACNTNLNSTSFIFDIEDSNIKDLLEVSECHVDINFIQKIIPFSIINKDTMRYNLPAKIYIKQDFKNFDDIRIRFTDVCMQNIEKIEDILINSYDDDHDRLIYYSIIKQNNANLIEKERDSFDCLINAEIYNNKNNKCFEMVKNPIRIYYKNETFDFGSKETFYHNSIVSSYIDKNNDSLSLYFYKEVNILISYCVLQDINSDGVSNYEILNQRLNTNNSNSAFFYMGEFGFEIFEPKIVFNDLDKNKNYKIKCIFDFLENDNYIELTYGENLLIPIKLNFNETKSDLGINCFNEEYMNNKLDTRYCDIIEHRLIFDIFYDTKYRYILNNFNYTDFALFSLKNREEKINHIKNIINNNNTISSSEIDLLSALSDYLFIIDCQDNVDCQNEKNLIFKNILIKYEQIDINNFDDKNKSQTTLNDVLLFYNIIQNTDLINYENFEFIINNIFNKRDLFFTNSINEYNYYLTNYFLIVFDRFISIIHKFKSINANQFQIDGNINIFKNELLIKFYNLFIGWISNGIIIREDKMNKICKNFEINYIESPVSSNVDIIIDSEKLLIKGFDSDNSKKLYKNIFSAGAISYKNFPLFSLDNKYSEAVTFFLYTDLRKNYENTNIEYREAFKIIFKKKKINNYCYLWDKDYLNDKKDMVNNFIITEYLNKDDDSNYNINCISRIMKSPMTVILGQTDIKGSLFKEGINVFSILVIILITLSLILISIPFALSKYYRRKEAENINNYINELN